MPAVGRPKADPNAPSLPKTPEEALAQGRITVDDIPAKNPEDLTVQQKIDQARVLLEQKSGLLEQIGKVRELLTLLTETGSGSREQVAWVRFYLPRKTRKTADGAEISDNGDNDEE